MSWQHVEQVMEHSKSRGPSRLVLMTIATHADRDGRAYPSIERIGRLANMSRRSVFDAIDRLVALGELERLYKGGGSGANLYVLRVGGGEMVRESALSGEPEPGRNAPIQGPTPCGNAHCIDGTVQDSTPCGFPHREDGTVQEPAPSERGDSAENDTVPESSPCGNPHPDRAEIRTQTVRKPAPEPSGTVREPSSVCRSDAAPAGGGEPPPGAETVIRFPTREGGEWELRNGTLAELRSGYPRLDVVSELRKARVWLLSNPGKRKTPNGMPRFVASWLGRADRDRVLPVRHDGIRASPTGRRRALSGGLSEEDRWNTALWE